MARAQGWWSPCHEATVDSIKHSVSEESLRDLSQLQERLSVQLRNSKELNGKLVVLTLEAEGQLAKLTRELSRIERAEHRQIATLHANEFRKMCVTSAEMSESWGTSNQNLAQFIELLRVPLSPSDYERANRIEALNQEMVADGEVFMEKIRSTVERTAIILAR